MLIVSAILVVLYGALLMIAFALAWSNRETCVRGSFRWS
jgi:hypothetical protein